MVTDSPSFPTDLSLDQIRDGNPIVKIRSLTLPGYHSFDKFQSPTSHSGQDLSSIDEGFETSKVLKHINKVLLKLSDQDLQGYCLPVGTKNSACCSLSLAEVGQHLVSLRTGYISRLARPVVQKFMSHPKNVNMFNHPVDPIALDLPNYNTIVREPMDLGTIRGRLQCGFYSSIQRCFHDIRLVFTNAITFNGPSHYVSVIAKELLEEFEVDVHGLEEKAVKECDRKNQHKCTLCSGSICQLCGEKCLKFETPSMFCCSTSCGQRIKKNAVYYISSDGNLVWCQKCYNGLPSSLYGDVPNVKPLPKRSLLKRKFDEEIAEPWVECDKCGNWFHQVCALYCVLGNNEVQPFTCPMCILETGKKPAVVSPLVEAHMPDSLDNDDAVKQAKYLDIQCSASPSSHIDMHESSSTFGIVTDQTMWKASSLPKTRLSNFLEAAVKDVLVNMGNSEIVGTIHIRMTSNYDNRQEIPISVRENFQTGEGNCLNEHIAYRQKCIQLFQTIDGVDVCLFCLYVQEFDASCPLPNRNSVYIAYLDSVDYIRPSSIRTIVYQEILVAYLKWAQARGFKQCHLWSCPPQRGDNFIFWCHPSHQRTPSRDRLNAWYSTIFQRCKALRISKQTDKFWNAYFASYLFNRREENSCRQAAKNSFIGKACGKRERSTAMSLPNSTVEPGSVNSELNNCSPVCPPIFDGDYWMLEFVRLHRCLMQKDPLTGTAQSQSHYRWCRDAIKTIFGKPMATAFRQPVDPVVLNIPTYFAVIKDPMDLGTVREKLRSNKYGNILAFVQDVRLVFRNAMQFNPVGHAIHEYARQLLSEFEKNLSEYVQTWLTPLFSGDGNFDELLAQCKLACHMSCLKNSDDMSCNATTMCSQVSFDCVTPRNTGALASSMITPFSSNNEMESAESRPKTVRIIVESEPFSEMKKKTISRVTSEDSTYLTVDISLAMIESDSFALDTDSSLPLSKKRRGNSLDSLSTAAETEDTFDMLNDEAVSIDLGGRDSLNSFRNIEMSELDFSAAEFNKNLDIKAFGNPVLAHRTLNALMTDLSKAVNRMSDDLFVVKFADIINPTTADTSMTVDTKPADQIPCSGLPKRRGRPPTNPSQAVKVQWSATCLMHLKDLVPDTSDPDPVIRSPLVDSRYTFLETCQYRHYQFDTLRRAKFSSLMILYYLHNPYDRSCRPTCKACQGLIHGMRWHCDQCADYDICHSCKMSHAREESSPKSKVLMEEESVSCQLHPHPLTPYRSTFR